MNDKNLDLEKEHPIGQGVGAAGGAVAGLAVGAAVGGPVGAVVGAAVGAIAGGAAGQGIAAAFDGSPDDHYWRENYSRRPYVKAGAAYDDYQDAYRYGWEARKNNDSPWDEASHNLEQGWEKAKLKSRLAWIDAKEAVRDGWHSVERALPGDADHDGR